MTIVLGYSPHGAPADGIGPFKEVFDSGLNLRHQDSLDTVDAIVLWGGEDISTSLYKETPIRYVASGPAYPSDRDLFEWHLMREATARGLPIIGVCAGAQRACAFAGGKLIQHVTGHIGGDHLLTTKDGELIWGNSCHHQMMYPYDVQHELLAWIDKPLSNTYLPEDKYYSVNLDKKQEKEPEVVYYTDIHALAVQGHPEWLSINHEFNKWFLNMVIQYCHIKE